MSGGVIRPQSSSSARPLKCQRKEAPTFFFGLCQPAKEGRRAEAEQGGKGSTVGSASTEAQRV